MQCNRGIFIKSQDQTVPCNQCMPCRINQGRQWTSRILMEQVTHEDYSWFVTLTYAPEHLPQAIDVDGAPVNTLRKKAFLKWLENQATNYGAFRYYAVGEYGDLNGRAHYHLAVFPEDLSTVNRLAHNWKSKFGHIQVTEITTQRARYLARYTAKKLTAAGDDRLRGSQEPEFRASSSRPPLGKKFADAVTRHYQTSKAAAEIVKTRGDIERTWRYDGKIYPIGQWPLTYIRKQLDIPLLHRDRIIANPKYLEYHQIQEALWDPQEAKAQETILNGKKIASLHRQTNSPKL